MLWDAFNRTENHVVRTTIKKRNCFLTTAGSTSSEPTYTHTFTSSCYEAVILCLENNSSISSPLSQTDPRFSKRFLKGFISKVRRTSDRSTSSPIHCGTCHLQSAHREDFALLFTSLRNTLIFKSQLFTFLTL